MDRAITFKDRLILYLIEQTGLSRDTIYAVGGAERRFYDEHPDNWDAAWDAGAPGAAMSLMDEFAQRFDTYVAEQTGLSRDTLKAVEGARFRFLTEHPGNIEAWRDAANEAAANEGD